MAKSKHKRKVEENAVQLTKAFKSKKSTSRRSREMQQITTPAVQKSQKFSRSGMELLRGSQIQNVIPINTQQRNAFAYMKGQHTNHKIFFSGKKNEKMENLSETGEKCVYIPVVNNPKLFTIINNTDGAICWDEGSFVYALVPRQLAIDGQSWHYLIKAFEVVEKATPAGQRGRGKNKTVGFESNKDFSRKANYNCVGLKANRSAPGLVYGNVEGFTGTKHEERLETNAKTYTNLCRKVLPDWINQSINQALKAVEFELPPKNDKEGDASEKKGDQPSMFVNVDSIFHSTAFGHGTYLEVHDDDDIYASGSGVYRGYDIIHKPGKKGKRYSQINFDAPVLKYFCFSVGHAVALRTGDVLFFNTSYDHCISTNTEACSQTDEETSDSGIKRGDSKVWCMSHYFKTLIAAGNDNSRV